MQILNTTTDKPDIGIMILGIMLIVVAIVCLCACINYMRRWKITAVAIFLFIGFCILAAMGVGVLKNNFMKRRMVYTVLIRNEKDLPEVLEHYELVNQTGRIYTIREKDTEFMEDIVTRLDAILNGTE